VFKMIPAERVGRVTAQASVLPVVSPDADDNESTPEPAIPKAAKPTEHPLARKHAIAPSVPAPGDDAEPSATSTKK
jgi:hypothetical protein